jgi:hypothetical protein
MKHTFKDMHADEISHFYIFMVTTHPFIKDVNGVTLYYNDKMFSVFEDPFDEYRSYAKDPIVWDIGGTTVMEKFAIRVDGKFSVIGRQNTESEDGIEIVDLRNGRTILKLGTDLFNDYYPTFVSQWMPENLYTNCHNDDHLIRDLLDYLQKPLRETFNPPREKERNRLINELRMYKKKLQQ